jgi:hypothetical protein
LLWSISLSPVVVAAAREITVVAAVAALAVI